MLLIGIIIGIVLSFLAMLWDADRQRPTLVWMDEDYKLHLVKRRKK